MEVITERMTGREDGLFVVFGLHAQWLVRAPMKRLFATQCTEIKVRHKTN